MERYTLRVAKTSTFLLDVEVKAESEEEAIDKAQEEAKHHDFSDGLKKDDIYDVCFVLEVREDD